jgi:hypothetical protein
MKTKTYIITAISIVLFAAAAMFSTIEYRAYKLRTIAVDTFTQAGHVWDMVHSPSCKCHE